jgi:hypothetical protein
MVHCFIEGNIRSWDENLPLLTMALHATVHRQTGITPNRLMLGEEVFLPVDLEMGIASLERTTPVEWVKRLTKSLDTGSVGFNC